MVSSIPGFKFKQILPPNRASCISMIKCAPLARLRVKAVCLSLNTHKVGCILTSTYTCVREDIQLDSRARKRNPLTQIERHIHFWSPYEGTVTPNLIRAICMSPMSFSVALLFQASNIIFRKHLLFS